MSAVKVCFTDEGLVVHSGRPYGWKANHPGAITYPSAHGLAKFLTWAESKGKIGPLGCLCGVDVLELGAGTGVVGLTCGRIGANVTLTDVDEQIQSLQTMSMAENGLFRMVSCSLDWAKPQTFRTGERFDLVVGSDCIYDGTAEIFAHALAAHLPHGSVGIVAVSYRSGCEAKSGPVETFFEAVARQGLQLERLEDTQGRAAGSGRGQPLRVYDGSSFKKLGEARWHAVARRPEFNDDNLDKLQIFRVCRH